MANNCFYTCRIAGKTKESVERFVAILKYQDYGFKDSRGLYLARTFTACCEQGVQKDGDFWYADVQGDVAWSLKVCWFGGVSSYYGEAGDKYPYGTPNFYVHRDAVTNEVIYANLIATVPRLCLELDCAMEAWSQEPGNCFQEHYLCDHDGECVIEDCVKWSEGEYDESTGSILPGTESGGFDDYGDLRPAECVYGR